MSLSKTCLPSLSSSARTHRISEHSLCDGDYVEVVVSDVEERGAAERDDRRSDIRVRDDLDPEDICNGPPGGCTRNGEGCQTALSAGKASYMRAVRELGLT